MHVFFLILIEGIVLSFILLITLVIGIANGPIGLVVMYEKDVQNRVIEKGLTTIKKIKKSMIFCSLAIYLPVLILTPFMAHYLNEAHNFINLFWQSTSISLIMGIFDRLFIDYYWVGKTKAWEINGTEDLKPYIPKKACAIKWFFTIIGLPAMCALSSFVFSIFI